MADAIIQKQLAKAVLQEAYNLIIDDIVDALDDGLQYGKTAADLEFDFFDALLANHTTFANGAIDIETWANGAHHFYTELADLCMKRFRFKVTAFWMSRVRTDGHD